MKNIDFLPVRYREGYAARAAVIKRWTIVLGISVIITPLAIYQYCIHAAVVQSFVLVEPEYMQAQAKSQRLAKLQQELQLARGEAALLAWLSHPWPRSQVLGQVHAPLPPSVRLTGIRLVSEPKVVAGTGPNVGRTRAARRSPEAETNAADESRPAAEKDLLRLLDQVAQNDSVVTLTGITVSTTELHTYVALLRTTGMFEKSELKSMETQPGQENTKAQTFEVRLVLSAGHATPLTKPEATPSETVSWPVGRAVNQLAGAP